MDAGLDAGGLSSEFIRTARASGLNGSTVIPSLRVSKRDAAGGRRWHGFSFMIAPMCLVEKVFCPGLGIGSYAVEPLLQSAFARCKDSLRPLEVSMSCSTF